MSAPAVHVDRTSPLGFDLGVVPTARRKTESFALRALQIMQAKRDRVNVNLPTAAPGLDLQRLRRKANPNRGYRPRAEICTFRVPLGIGVSAYEQIRKAALSKWVREMDAKGWEIRGDYPIQVKPGVYPAIDLATNMPLLGEREAMLQAFFSPKAIQTVTLELPANLFAPVSLQPSRRELAQCR